MKYVIATILAVLVAFFVFSRPEHTDTMPSPTETPKLHEPIARASERITKKPFGIFVTPQNSPVQPERFRGYHTGTDFETFPNEQDTDVAVMAICTGTVAVKRSASGYGGLVVQRCEINNQQVTVLYGHVRLASVDAAVGDTLEQGKPFAVLGKGFSSDAGGERKHLHLGIHRGTMIDIRGYVQQQSELEGWIDSQLPRPLL